MQELKQAYKGVLMRAMERQAAHSGVPAREEDSLMASAMAEEVVDAIARDGIDELRSRFTGAFVSKKATQLNLQRFTEELGTIERQLAAKQSGTSQSSIAVVASAAQQGASSGRGGHGSRHRE